MASSCARYLRLLGVDGRPSGLSALRTIVRRHLERVPFENVSKLILAGREPGGRPTTLDEYLDGIEHSDLGGTCYTSNPFLAELLRALGYDVDLLGADMTNPNVHTCIRVHIDGVAYHVDIGFAAPLREPISIDSPPIEINEGNNRYVLERHDQRGGVRLQMFSGQENGAGYVGHDPPRSREFFDPIVLKSFAPEATFMNWLRISRVFEDRSLDLINRTLYRHARGTTSITELKTIAELTTAVREEFNMPRCPVEQAIAVLERNTGKAFFEVSE